MICDNGCKFSTAAVVGDESLCFNCIMERYKPELDKIEQSINSPLNGDWDIRTTDQREIYAFTLHASSDFGAVEMIIDIKTIDALRVERIKGENVRPVNWLADLLDRVDCEFGRLSGLDCPEYVNPDPDLWCDIIKSMDWLEIPEIPSNARHQFPETERGEKEALANVFRENFDCYSVHGDAEEALQAITETEFVKVVSDLLKQNSAINRNEVKK